MNPSYLVASAELLDRDSCGPRDPDATVAVIPDEIVPPDATVLGTVNARAISGGCYTYTPDLVLEVLKYKARHLGADAISNIKFTECSVTSGSARHTAYSTGTVAQGTSFSAVTSQVGLTAVSAIALRTENSTPEDSSAEVMDMRGTWTIQVRRNSRTFSGTLSVTEQQGATFQGTSSYSDGARCQVLGRVFPRNAKIIIAALSCFPGHGPNSHELIPQGARTLIGRSDSFTQVAYGYTTDVSYVRQ